MDEDRSRPIPSCSLTEMLAEIEANRDAIYDGPGAHTIAEMIEDSPFAQGTIRERAKEKVDSGEWVQVSVQRIIRGTGKAHYPLAWVKRTTYEEWKDKRGSTKKLGEKENV
jgi:hypothetical protein